MIEVGQVFQDNDPRMTHRQVRIVAVEAGSTIYQNCSRDGVPDAGGYTFKAQTRRFHTDGKPRRSGFSLLPKFNSREKT